MTKEEFYSNIREYKAGKSLKHGNDPEVWERDSFDFAVAALTKSKLAKYAGEVADASRFETEYNGYMNKLAHMDERAAKALEQKVLASAEAKYRECLTKLIAAKHSDESLSALSHGAKWQKHKYIRIENGRYIYPDDDNTKTSKSSLAKTAEEQSRGYRTADQQAGEAAKNQAAYEAMKKNSEEAKKRNIEKRVSETARVAQEAEKARGEAMANKEKKSSEEINKTADELYKKWFTEMDSNGRDSKAAYEKVTNGMSKEIKDAVYEKIFGGIGEYKPLSGESLTKEMDFDKIEKDINNNLDKQDKNGSSVQTKSLNEYKDLTKEEQSEYIKMLADAYKQVKKGQRVKVERNENSIVIKIYDGADFVKSVGIIKHSLNSFDSFLAHALDAKVSF